MMKPFLLAILFLTSAFLQVTFLNALGLPLSLIPLHVTLGALIFHRSGAEYGVAWFFSSMFLLPMIGFSQLPALALLLCGFLGALFTERLFTNRSLYALEGLGVTLVGLILVVQAVSTHIHVTSSFILTTYAFTIPLLYGEFMIALMIDKSLKTFVVSRSHVVSS